MPESTPRDPLDILRTVFGHQHFRGQQEDVVRHVAAGGDAVVLFPTGAGKSMCYQVPALSRFDKVATRSTKVTLQVSPLARQGQQT